jgi:hypothetical protein
MAPIIRQVVLIMGEMRAILFAFSIIQIVQIIDNAAQIVQLNA